MPLIYEEYLLHFLDQYPEAKAKLIEGGLFDPELMNIVYHNAAAGVGMQILCNSLDISNPRLVFIAATHDWDKMLDRLGAENEGSSINPEGHRIVRYNVAAEIQRESRKTGILRVTGNNLTDYKIWTFEEMMLRYIDSCLGINGKRQEAIIDWRERINQLRNRHTDVNRDAGILLYEGRPFYDVLWEITQFCEEKIYAVIREKNPHLANQYPEGDVWKILSDAIASDIAAS